MDEWIIKVENLAKVYFLEAKGDDHLAFRHAASRFFQVNWGRLRSILGSSTNETLKYSEQSREEFWALRDVSFEIKPGERVGVIGRNGAGKSTLLKILGRITEPTTGRVRIRGRVASLLEVGTGFHPELSGRDNIFLNGSILGMTRAEITRKFDEIVEFSGVERFLETPVKRYSSGMYVRLAFAVAAHLDPEILLVDEVLAVGDADFQKKCLGKMNEISSSQGKTIFFVSHNIGAIESLCNSCLFLEQGKIRLFSQDKRKVISDYFHLGINGNLPYWKNETDSLANPWFTPTTFSLVTPQDSIIQNPVSRCEEIWVKIEGVIGTLDPSLVMSFAMFNETETVVYSSFHTDGPEKSWPKLVLGQNVLYSKVPLSLFNEGTYRFELNGQLYNRQRIVSHGARMPSIILEIRGGVSSSPQWNVVRSGIISPVCEWRNESLVSR